LQGVPRLRPLLPTFQHGLQIDLRPRRSLRRGLGEQHFAKIKPDHRLQKPAATIKLLTECRLAPVQIRRHVRVMIAYPREHEDHRLLAVGWLVRCQHALRIARFQRRDGLGVIATDHRLAELQTLASGLQRVGHIGQIEFGMLAQMRAQPRQRLIQRVLRPGRQHQQLRLARRTGGLDLWRFFQNEVHIGAAQSHHIHAGATHSAVPVPWNRLGGDEERAMGEVDVRVGRLEVKYRRNQLVLQRKRRLDQSGHTRCAIQMSCVRLDRTDRAVPHPIGTAAIGLGQRRHFDRIAQFGRRAVRFHVADGVCVHASVCQSLGNCRRLAIDAGCRVAHLERAIVVDGRTLDHGINVIAVGQRIFQALEHHHAHAVADHRSPGVGIEGSGMAVGRIDAALFVHVACLTRDGDIDATGHGHIALTMQQTLAGQMHRHTRGRTEGLHRHRRPLQVQLVGHARCQRVIAVAHADL